MKRVLQLMLFVSFLFSNMLNACYGPNAIIEFTESEIFVPTRLGKLNLYKDGDGFHVVKDGKIYDVQSCFCDRMLCKVSNEQLLKFLGRDKPQIIVLSPEEFSQLEKADLVEITEVERARILSQLFHRGYISVNQMDDGEYILRVETGLSGGWPSWKKVLKGALYGAGGCVLAVGGCVLAAGLAGTAVLVGPIMIVHSTVEIAAWSGVVSFYAAPTAAAIASAIPLVTTGASVFTGAAFIGIPTLAAVGAGGGAIIAAATGASPERPQPSQPVTGSNPVPTENSGSEPYEPEIIP